MISLGYVWSLRYQNLSAMQIVIFKLIIKIRYAIMIIIIINLSSREYVLLVCIYIPTIGIEYAEELHIWLQNKGQKLARGFFTMEFLNNLIDYPIKISSQLYFLWKSS